MINHAKFFVRQNVLSTCPGEQVRHLVFRSKWRGRDFARQLQTCKAPASQVFDRIEKGTCNAEASQPEEAGQHFQFLGPGFPELRSIPSISNVLLVEIYGACNLRGQMKAWHPDWSNYSDLTWPHPKKVAEKGKSPYFKKNRLGRYHNLARIQWVLRCVSIPVW